MRKLYIRRNATVSCLSLMLVMAGCSESSHEEKQLYYPNGVLYKRITKKHGHWDGPVWTYYSTGYLKSKTFWRDDAQHGPAFFYYPTGGLQEVTQWRNGKAQGKSVSYYRNGKQARQSTFDAGVEIGNVITYDSMGRLLQVEEQDRLGRVIRLRNYSKTGALANEILMPIIEAPDTIQLGENYTGCVYFGYPLAGRPILLIGKLVKNLKAIDRYQIKDTIAVVRSNQQGRFCFSYQPQSDRSGEHTFSYKFLQSGHEHDSISIHWLSGTHNFYVRATPNVL